MVLFLNGPQQQSSTTGMPASSRKECPQVPALSFPQSPWRIHKKACEWESIESSHVPAPSYSGLLLSQHLSFKNLLKLKLLSSYPLSQGPPLSPTLHLRQSSLHALNLLRRSQQPLFFRTPSCSLVGSRKIIFCRFSEFFSLLGFKWHSTEAFDMQGGSTTPCPFCPDFSYFQWWNMVLLF